MEEQHTWEQALAMVQTRYRSLSPDIRLQLDRLIDEIMQLKQDMLELVLSVGSSAVCGACGGECCLYGKYHVTILDVMAFQTTGIDPIAPNFSSAPYCPYSDAAGCRMTPRYRPMTCVVFNCDLIEERLTVSGRDALQARERKLRDAISRASLISSIRLDRPVLFITDHDVAA